IAWPDRRGPGPVELAVVDPAFAPDQVRLRRWPATGEQGHRQGGEQRDRQPAQRHGGLDMEQVLSVSAGPANDNDWAKVSRWGLRLSGLGGGLARHDEEPRPSPLFPRLQEFEWFPV